VVDGLGCGRGGCDVGILLPTLLRCPTRIRGLRTGSAPSPPSSSRLLL